MAKENLVDLSDYVRVEDGPLRRTEIATEELLSDEVTARHYQVGKPDAAGNIITLGKEMTFLDFKAKRVWYVYKFQAVMEDLPPEFRVRTERRKAEGTATEADLKALETGQYECHRYFPVRSFASKDDAIEFGKKLVSEMEI